MLKRPELVDAGGKYTHSGPTPRGRDAAVAWAAYSKATSAATTRLMFVCSAVGARKGGGRGVVDDLATSQCRQAAARLRVCRSHQLRLQLRRCSATTITFAMNQITAQHHGVRSCCWATLSTGSTACHWRRRQGGRDGVATNASHRHSVCKPPSHTK